ncbi:MAG: hypothetical protein GY851_03330 [bacterium]|nr:hypothetical protein [bacterium]
MPQDSLFDNKGPAASPVMFRSGETKGAPTDVDREKQVIYGYAVCTRGEALGHDFWCDGDFLKQIVKMGNRKKLGIKGRYTHPGLSGDGLGKHLGRSKNFRLDGDVVRADLHMAASASETPDGDLAGYAMTRAEEDPESFGASIVFRHDCGEEERFATKHKGEEGRFESPDEDNASNLIHARMAEFNASDLVGDPAANPGGFFSANGTEELAARAESLFSYACGITETVPTPEELGGIHPERLRAFWISFAQRHGITVGASQQQETQMADEEKKDEQEDEKKKDEQAEGEDKEKDENEDKDEKKDENGEFPPKKEDDDKDEDSQSAKLASLRANETFGENAVFVLEAHDEGWTSQHAENVYLRRQLKAQKADAVKKSETAEAAGSSAANEESSTSSDFMEQAKLRAKADNSSLAQAIKKLAHEQPEMHRGWVNGKK